MIIKKATGWVMKNDDTIIALASPPGSGALAILRISGPDTFLKIKKKIVEKKKFDRASPQEIKLYTIFGSKQRDVIDEVTIVQYCSPSSFTGEDMVEIICHGGTVVVERLLESLVDTGIRYAERGEFTRRALYNGKTDIIKAESINQMIQSTSIIQQKNAVRSYIGGYESLISDWKEQVEEILVEVESEIEFNDSDDIAEREIRDIIKEKVATLKEAVLLELKKRDSVKEVEKGIHVLIVGPRNAGKSTLFNLLLGFERSIVDEQKGTTRDFVSESRRIKGVSVSFIDTAGFAETRNRVEKEGVQRTRDLFKEAKIIVWVTAADEEIKSLERNIETDKNQKLLGVINKIDLSDGAEKEVLFKESSIPYIKITATDKNENDKIEQFIVGQIGDILASVQYDCIISNKRQERIIEDINLEINEIERQIGREEIVAFHCRNILEKLEEYVGKTTSDVVLDKIFDEFCIGK